jgi:transcription elongation GreA/GreB family factor
MLAGNGYITAHTINVKGGWHMRCWAGVMARALTGIRFRMRLTFELMNKTQLLKQIVARLSESLGVLEKAARASHAEATHESSKAENKYDTRGLEAAYLASGQVRQAKEILDAMELYGSLSVREFGPGEAIDLTALVELDSDGMSFTYFIGPKNGGLEVEFQGKEVTVITPQSPLGQNLMGKKAGQRWTAKVGGSTVKYYIVSVR